MLISSSHAQDQSEPSKRFNDFIKQQAAALQVDDKVPATLDEWTASRDAIRFALLKAWGGFPETPCPLEARSLGELKRDRYTVEKIVFQTMPNVWMTANAYVPEVAPGQTVPAVLCVHGHWPGAKQDPVVQSRCIGLVRLGFFVLCVDAFGAGERAIEKKLGEYHGEMTGAMLLPIGKPLSGIQVYENMRAVDYLQSRPEVIASRIGITGASGGGNQSMYAGAMDDRFQCVVPTCSVGTIQAYLSAACCMCEVVPGILRSTEEGNVLGLAADRGLMVTSATRDAYQFSVDQAKISVSRAQAIAALVSTDGESDVRHTIIEAPHQYNQPMREAMYGWMTKYLKEEGDGSPIAESEIVPEDPETLRCFPDESRPDDFVTIPRFAFAEVQRLKQIRRDGLDSERLTALSEATSETEKIAALSADRDALAAALGPMPAVGPLNLETVATKDGNSIELIFYTEHGLEISAKCDLVSRDSDARHQKLAVLLDVDRGSELTFSGEIARDFRAKGYAIVAPELRATGRFAGTSDKIGNAVDHNSAEWSLLIGRPLLGQWVFDVRRTLDALTSQMGTLPIETVIVANGSSSVIAIAAAALDHRLVEVTTINGLASYLSDSPYRKQRLGILVPGLLRDVGDIDHISALIAPRLLTVRGAVNGAGETLQADEIDESLRYCEDVYSRHNASSRLKVLTGP